MDQLHERSRDTGLYRFCRKQSPEIVAAKVVVVVLVVGHEGLSNPGSSCHYI
tara:strand:+ start:893 stop:1048 length:156 start_codon:yes stop_codon:yes gene_type:complete